MSDVAETRVTCPICCFGERPPKVSIRSRDMRRTVIELLEHVRREHGPLGTVTINDEEVWP